MRVPAPAYLLVGCPRSARPWLARLAELPGPRILLILGSGTKRLGLDGAAAEALGRLVAESAANLGAAVLVSAATACAARASISGLAVAKWAASLPRELGGSGFFCSRGSDIYLASYPVLLVI